MAGVLDILSPLAAIIDASRKKGGKKEPTRDSTPSFKRGGTMKKKGVARLHKDETIKSPRKKMKRGRGR